MSNISKKINSSTNHLKIIKSHKKVINFKNFCALIVLLSLSILGVHLITAGHSQSPFSSAEPETGNLSGSASIQPSTSTSGGNYIQFGSAQTSSAASKIGIFDNATNVSGVQSVSSQLGHPIPYVMDFLAPGDWTQATQSNWPYPAWTSAGYTNYQMIWGVPMLPNTFTPNQSPTVKTGSTYGLAQGAAGAYNQYFVTIAQNLVNNGQSKSFIRLGWEFNLQWTPWTTYGNTTDFIKFYQNIVTSMRSVPGQQFKFEWNPNRGDQGIGDLATFYPGDAYVDVVGLDVYDVEWSNYPFQSFSGNNAQQSEWQWMLTESYGLNWLNTFATQHSKQISFPEWGIGNWGGMPNCANGCTNKNVEVGGGDNAYYVQQMAAWVASHNVVHVLAWDDGQNFPNSANYPMASAAFYNSFK